MEKNDFDVQIDAFGKKALMKYNGSDKVVTVPDGIVRIDTQAFADLDFIDTVILPDSVTFIGYAAFQGSSISHITVGKNVTLLGAFVFGSCKNLKTVVIQNPTISFGRAPFQNGSDDFEIVFEGSCDQFKKIASRAYYSSGEYQSGDYHHPSSTHFEYYKYTVYAHIFSNTLSTPFTCKVKCADGEIVYHEMKEETWVERE